MKYLHSRCLSNWSNGNYLFWRWYGIVNLLVISLDENTKSTELDEEKAINNIAYISEEKKKEYYGYKFIVLK